MTNKRGNLNLALTVAVLILLAVRVFALFYVENIHSPQIWEQELLANNLLQGKGFYYTNYGTEYKSTAMVLYSLLCAAVYYFTGHSYLALKIIQILISLLTCFLIYRICKNSFGAKVAPIALLLCLAHPGLIVFSVKMHPLTLDIFLFTLIVYFLLLVIEGQKIPINSFLCGLSIGAALLTRPTVGLFVPIIFIILLKTARPFRQYLFSVLCLMIGMTLVILPLIIRNYLVFKRFVILPNDSAVNFWKGNNPYTIGTANTLQNESVLLSAPKGFLKELWSLDEFGQKELFYREALNFIRSNPKDSLLLFLRKLYYFWWFSPTQGFNYPKLWFFGYKLFYSTLLFFFIIGCFAGIRKVSGIKQQMIYGLFLFIITISIAQSLYYVDGRHRWAIESLMLIFSAAGISTVWSGLKKL